MRRWEASLQREASREVQFVFTGGMVYRCKGQVDGIETEQKLNRHCGAISGETFPRASKFLTIDFLNLFAPTTSLPKAGMSTTTSSVHADEVLTDEQMEEMLANATARLQAKARAEDIVTLDQGQKYTFPKLETAKLVNPYVSTIGDIATLDAPRLLDERHRKQAKGVRRVQDPGTAKKIAEEVCVVSALPS